MSWKENSFLQNKMYSSTNSNSNLKGMQNNNNKCNNYRDRSFTTGEEYNNNSSNCNNNNNLMNNRGQTSPIKLNNSTNTRNNNKNEQQSPNYNVRFSPKMRNSYSCSWTGQASTSPFKQQQYNGYNNNNNNNRSVQNSPDKNGDNYHRKRNNSGGHSPSSNHNHTGGALNGNVAVPNPFGGPKFHEPPSAELLPLPPSQWTLIPDSQSDDSMIDQNNNSNLEGDSLTIIQKLNYSYSRLTAPVKA